nr:hypothetical protein B0A51_13774 [Rachicladosporium sp. CCFEE 5018]
MADAYLAVPPAIDETIKSLDALTLVSHCTLAPPTFNAAARVFGISEVVETILLDTVQLGNASDICWLYIVQRVNKSFAHTIQNSTALQRVLSAEYNVGETPSQASDFAYNPLFKHVCQSHYLAAYPPLPDRPLSSMDILVCAHCTPSELKALVDWLRGMQATSWAKAKYTDLPCKMPVMAYLCTLPFHDLQYSSNYGSRGSMIENPTLGDIAMRVTKYYDLAYPQ